MCEKESVTRMHRYWKHFKLLCPSSVLTNKDIERGYKL